uniref:Uncharacterized protein n=1 Tax=viral metagenome TaxID=1070528 RepID=A0A6H1ZJC4_9ZZZZ
MITYTLKQVKEAFWKTFKGAGELWFSYFDRTPEEVEGMEEDVNAEWKDFLENLQGVRNTCFVCTRSHLPEVPFTVVPAKCLNCGRDFPFSSVWIIDGVSPFCQLCFNKRLRK